jgi:hypothetical protein
MTRYQNQPVKDHGFFFCREIDRKLIATSKSAASETCHHGNGFSGKG